MRKVRFLWILLFMGPALMVAGCSNPVEPDDPESDDDEVYYDVQINLWRLEVIGDCDANLALGLPNQGEFAYKVDVEYENEEGDLIMDGGVVYSSLYGNPQEGEMYKRNDGESIEFSAEHGNDVSSLFTVREGTSYEIHLYVIEWDGNDADSRMRGERVTERILVDRDGVGLDLKAGGHVEDCRVSLRGNTLHQLGSKPEPE